MNVWPAIASVPVRCEVLALGATLKLAVPLPLPLEPPVTVIQLAAVVVVHEHPAGAVTVAEPVPPPATTVWLSGATEYVHGTPAWVTVKVCPPTEIVPVRCEMVPFAATLNDTVPFPFPVAPPVTVIQAALLVALHVHPDTADTVNDPVPPVAVSD